jgi:hypothetical protein
MKRKMEASPSWAILLGIAKSAKIVGKVRLRKPTPENT